MKLPFELRKDKNLPASLLIGAGVLMIPGGFLRWYFYNSHADFGVSDWGVVLSAPIYIVLGFVARRLSDPDAFIPASIAFLVHIVTRGLVFSRRSLEPMMDGSLIGNAVLVLLTWAFLASSFAYLKRWDSTHGFAPVRPQDQGKIRCVLDWDHHLLSSVGRCIILPILLLPIRTRPF